MALQSYRTEVGNGASVNIDNFMNTTGEAGFIVVYNTATSGVGASFDDTGAVVALSAVQNTSGEAIAGILLQDVVNKDLSQTHLNVHKRETNIGGKVALLKRGTIVTNALSGNMAPVPGQRAFYTNQGIFTNVASVDSNLDLVNAPIGRFTSSRNADGYVKIDINIV